MELVILIAVLSGALAVVHTALYGKFIKAASDFDEGVGRMLTKLAS